MEKNFYAISCDSALENLSSGRKGLTDKECTKRLSKYGMNALPKQKKLNGFLKFLLQFKDIMIIILLVACIASFVLGEYVDGGVILAIVVMNALLGFLQESKAEKAMESLKNLTKPLSKVIRNGEAIKVKSEEVVVGDILILEAGDIVCADARLVESAMLKCDESSLTGESVPVIKNANEILKDNTPLADRVNMVYSGSVVSYGHGLAVVVSTGPNTEIGKIAQMLKETKEELTPLQKSLKFVGKIITVAVLLIAVLTFVLELTISDEINILDAVLISVALAVAAIPESLPAIVTIIMSLGVSKLAKKKAIVKKLHAIETLGCCEVICSDKTGTLTQNVMTVKKVWYSGTALSDVECDKNDGGFQQLAKIMSQCNDSIKQENRFVGDPTETALTTFAFGYGIDKEELDKKNPRKYEIPFDSNRKRMSTINGNEMLVKGGVDEILSVCNSYFDGANVVSLTDELREEILKANSEMSDCALRVLAGAYKVACGDDYVEENLTFVGLVGMIDPPRIDVAEAVAKCKRAGMRPVMITGDHKDTAFAIARQIGIADSVKEVVTGNQLDKLSEDELLEKVKNASVFARVSPENKVQIVNAFKKLGKIVAMTGDGVNDAPSLKNANIGVGMGITGTDVTKEVANMIVTDDSFSTIVVAVEEGRKIYSNIQKSVNYLLAGNLCEILVILLGVIFFPNHTILSAIQILFINLVSDSFSALSLGVEPSEKNVMEIPPRNAKKNFLSGNVWKQILLQGSFQTALVITSFVLGFYVFGGAKVATTMTFITLNLVELLFVFTVRTNGSMFKINPLKNKTMLICVSVLIAFVLVVCLTPISVFMGLTKIGVVQWLVAVGLAILIIPINELIKLCMRAKK